MVLTLCCNMDNFNDQNEAKNYFFTQLLENRDLLKEIIINMIPLSNFVGISDGSTYCPFHQDVRHKSAKIYEDEDGISRMYCFGQCQTQYTSYDYIVKILKQNPFTYLLSKYSSLRILEAINNYKNHSETENIKVNYVKMKIQNSENLVQFIDNVYFDE